MLLKLFPEMKKHEKRDFVLHFYLAENGHKQIYLFFCVKLFALNAASIVSNLPTRLQMPPCTGSHATPR